jgi:hypothetical protein
LARRRKDELVARAERHAGCSSFQMTRPGPILPATVFLCGVRVPPFFRYDDSDDEDERLDRRAYAAWRMLLCGEKRRTSFSHPHPLVGTRWAKDGHVREVICVVDDRLGRVFVHYMGSRYRREICSVPLWLAWVAGAVRLDNAQQRDTASAASEPLEVQHG